MTLVLDPDIRDWVVLPLFLVIVVTGMIRQSVSVYMNITTQTRVPIPIHIKRVQSLLQSSSYLRLQSKALVTNHIITSSQQFQQYVTYRIALLRNETQHVQALKDKASVANSDPMNPNGTTATPALAGDPMMDMMMKNPMSLMGGNMIFMVQNMVMMQGIQHFFSGFILLQVPFSLTMGFRTMFLKGIVDMPNLSSSFVSSVSFYFLVIYSLRGFLSLLIGQPPYEQKEQDMFVQQSLGYQNPPNPASPNGKQDFDSLIKMLQNEIDHLELMLVPKNIEYENNVEQRLLGPSRYPKKATRSSKDTSATSNTDLLFSISQSKTSSSSKKASSVVPATKKLQ
jgi:ER membrane protein complex subunit 3